MSTSSDGLGLPVDLFLHSLTVGALSPQDHGPVAAEGVRHLLRAIGGGRAGRRVWRRGHPGRARADADHLRRPGWQGWAPGGRCDAGPGDPGDGARPLQRAAAGQSGARGHDDCDAADCRRGRGPEPDARPRAGRPARHRQRERRDGAGHRRLGHRQRPVGGGGRGGGWGGGRGGGR